MSPISDQELQRHLSRRTSKSMPAADREDVLVEVAAVRSRPRFSFRMRPRLLLAPIAAAVVVVLVGVPLMWTLSPGPRLSPSPSPGAVTIYTAQQLSDMIGDPAWVGHYVLAHAELGPMRQPPGVQCAAPDPCQDAYLVGVTGQNVVAIDWRDAPPGQGTQLQDGRQVQLLALPTSESVLAFKVSSASVEYLGPADLSPDGTPMTVPAATSSAPSAPVDDVYVVSGWLVATPGMPCPYVPGSPTDPNDGYLCNGAFLTADRTYTETAGGTGGSFPASGLHVQYGAYEQFAPDPASTALRGPEPRYGTYLVRAAGCPTFVSGDCPVFRMVGRLDEASANPSLVPSPTPSRAPLNVLTQDQLIALANDPTAIGRVVIANAQLAPVPMPSPSAACAPPDACDIGQIGVNPGVPVMAGWREATMPGEGIFDLTEGHWFVRLQPPAAFQKQVLALRIGRGSVEYLGTVQETGSSLVWSPSDVPAGSAAPSSIYAVNGWLVRTPPIPCPAPTAVDLSYYCGGSFIAPTPTDFNHTSDSLYPGWLHVQRSAYDNFAPNPTTSAGGGSTSDRAIYLVRPVGQLPYEPNAWSLVGRLDPPMTGPTPSAGVTP